MSVRGHRVGGRRGQGVLHAFVGEHEKDLIAAIEQFGNCDGAGQRSAVLIEAAHRFLGAGLIGEERRGVEGGVLVEFVKRAVERVRAVPRDDIDRAAARMAVSRIGLKALGLHFGHRIHGRVIGDTQVAGIVGRAVDQ